MKVRIFHNNSRIAAKGGGFRHVDTVTEVYAFDDAGTLDFMDPGSEQVIWEWFTLTEDPSTWPIHPCPIDYLLRGNRGLRLGDVVALGDTYFTPTPGRGLDELESAPKVRPVPQPGTVPFARPEIDLRSKLGQSLLSSVLWAKELLVRLPDWEDLEPADIVKFWLAFVSAIVGDELDSASEELREQVRQTELGGAADPLEP